MKGVRGTQRYRSGAKKDSLGFAMRLRYEIDAVEDSGFSAPSRHRRANAEAISVLASCEITASRRPFSSPLAVRSCPRKVDPSLFATLP